jgi:hypothetical protein
MPNPFSTLSSRVAWPVLFGIAMLAAAASGGAATASVGEGSSRASLRPLTTDRPDATESPFTVDAGHVQVEMDFARRARNDQKEGRTTEWNVVPFNLRFGVSPRFEMGLFIAPYVRLEEDSAEGGRTARAGFGDLTLRGKFNVRGNDGGAIALGLIVDLTLPTARSGLGSGSVAGGVFLPLTRELAGGWSFGAMTGATVQHRTAGRGLGATWINTATLGHALGAVLSGYVELTSAAGERSHEATFDTGLTWQVDADTQFDVGAALGLSHAADAIVVFAGVARRF